MVIQPQTSSTGAITANTTFLSPSFEAVRARLLKMPFTEDLQIIPWEEHWNPYLTLLNAWPQPSLSTASSPPSRVANRESTTISHSPKVIVDEEMRDFIVRGLHTNGFTIRGLSGETEKVKQTKSPREIEILRAVNTGTVEAIRAMRSCLVKGLTENEVADVLDDTMRAGGLDPFFDIVLFGKSSFDSAQAGHKNALPGDERDVLRKMREVPELIIQ